MTLIALQPLAPDQVYMPQMKAVYVLFDMVYNGLMSCQRLQRDRPKCLGRLVESSQTTECKTVSKTILF